MHRQPLQPATAPPRADKLNSPKTMFGSRRTRGPTNPYGATVGMTHPVNDEGLREAVAMGCLPWTQCLPRRRPPTGPMSEKAPEARKQVGNTLPTVFGKTRPESSPGRWASSAGLQVLSGASWASSGSGGIVRHSCNKVRQLVFSCFLQLFCNSLAELSQSHASRPGLPTTRRTFTAPLGNSLGTFFSQHRVGNLFPVFELLWNFLDGPRRRPPKSQQHA